MSAIIVECTFVDSVSDMSRYNTEKVVKTTFKCACRLYGIKVNSSGQEEQRYFRRQVGSITTKHHRSTER